MNYLEKGAAVRKGTELLLRIKDSEIRILDLEQCRTAVDRGIHIGGAFSSVVPLVALYYGGYMRLDITDTTRRGQDVFILSKGHSVATMASIFADKGYFDMALLKNSRSYDSILNGHPGPVLPGVQISTGPLGQGISVSAGFAAVGRESPRNNVYCLTGDGELQEGSNWEGIMYAGENRLDNLCAIIDRNNGQLDDTSKLVLPLGDLAEKFESFGWRVFDVDGTQYGTVCGALESFVSTRGGRPTAIISNTQKGYGGFSSVINKHKANLSEEQAEREIRFQRQRLGCRTVEFADFMKKLKDTQDGIEAAEETAKIAAAMGLEVAFSKQKGRPIEISKKSPEVLLKRAPARIKSISYDESALPELELGGEYAASSVITDTMRVFAADRKIISIDADLSSTSGLMAGVADVDKNRALNVGIAETNMMCMGESFAASGCNVWMSTFCPFFDWRALRRIAVGYEERLEAMKPGGWLGEGHGLDMTFVAAAANLDTQTNGATHMGNDDICVFGGTAHLKVIDTSCPRQLLNVMKWIAKGDRGLVYLRIMRSKAAVLYGRDSEFEYGRGYPLKVAKGGRAVIVSSGRGVHEALAAEKLLKDVGADVVDMPSVDERMMVSLAASGKALVFAEQNNGFLASAFMKTMFKYKQPVDPNKVAFMSTLDADGNARFIHSGTYAQLITGLGLTPGDIAGKVKELVYK